MNAWNRQRRKRDLEDRKVFVKEKSQFDDVIEALDLLSQGAPHPDCPHCDGVAVLRRCHGGEGYYCSFCDETGDMIDLVRVRRNVGFTGAIEILEEIIALHKCGGTGRLL
jgi:hypothetical protein